MTKEEAKKAIKIAVEDQNKYIERLELEYEQICNAKEITNNDIFKNPCNFFDIDIKVDLFPNSHYKKGKIAKATIKKEFYLNRIQKEIIENYIKWRYSPDYVYRIK